MLQKLVVVRHGEYDMRDHLTDKGRQKAADLAEILATQLNGLSVALLSSTADRAVEMSEILATRLGVEFEKHDCLHSGGGHIRRDELSDAIELVAEKGETHEVVILSTHLEYIDEFPRLWGKTQGLSIREEMDTPKGTARVVDVQTGEVEHLRPSS